MSDEEQSQIDDTEVPTESEPVEQNALSLSHMRDCLSILAKIDHGLKYAYTRFQAMERNFTDISFLANYRYIRYIDVSGNNLSDISCLKNLPNLLLLDAERNQLTEANLGPCPYLQILNLAQNRIESTAEFEYPYLRHLNLNNNAIESLSGFDTFKCDGLRKLELRGNRLKTTANIALPKLEELYLAENQIAVIEGLETMTSLSILHLRGNPIQSLDGFSDKNKKLTYLNLRQTQVENMTEIEKLQVYL